jgi:hypothetical protein
MCVAHASMWEMLALFDQSVLCLMVVEPALPPCWWMCRHILFLLVRGVLAASVWFVAIDLSFLGFLYFYFGFIFNPFIKVLFLFSLVLQFQFVLLFFFQFDFYFFSLNFFS